MSKKEVFSNLAITLDGKITTKSRENFSLGSEHDRTLMRVIRERADTVVMGGETLRTWKKACLPQSSRRIQNAIVSRSLRGIDSNWEFFRSTRIDRILFVGGEISARRLKEFQARSEIVFLNPKKSIASQVIHALRERKKNSILIEGGGGLMWEFVRENRIDRYYVTLTPRIVGGKNAPTLVDGLGLSSDRAVNLRLEKLERRGSEIFLVYKKLSRRGKRHPLYH